MIEPTQNELAKERTHAAWLRTSLAFLVALIAMKHYAPELWATATLLAVGGSVSSLRAMFLASDGWTRLTAAGLVFAPTTILFASAPLT